MEYFLAPNGKHIPIPAGRVTTFGLTEEQNELIRGAFPTKDYELLDTDAPTDLIAVYATSQIINASALDADGLELLFEYYNEVIDHMGETVFWLGYPKPPHPLRIKFRCYENFGELAVNLKYHLLTAQGKAKKIKDFSKRLADSLLILSLIRLHPGIKTRELAEKTEQSIRTVQRYIATLQATGEWIEYNTASKGWELQSGISVLFGDHLK
ncbi:MAG: HTH domain-containing protein [Clostridia bacterium]|nr:HTH domain-containing protein [Clostridia bacterium]